jgi:hypothetical protein
LLSEAVKMPGRPPARNYYEGDDDADEPQEA